MINKIKKIINSFAGKDETPSVIFNKSNIVEINIIRQRIKDEFAEAPKLQDPQLLEKLIHYAFLSQDAISRSHIRKLMDALGEPWLSRYNTSNQQRIAECERLK